MTDDEILNRIEQRVLRHEREAARISGCAAAAFGLLFASVFCLLFHLHQRMLACSL